MILQPFYPKFGSGQTFSATNVSASGTIPSGDKQIMLTNTGANTVFVRVSQSTDTAAATAADMPILINTQVVMTINENFTRLSYIAPAGTATLHVIVGEGF